MTHLNGTTSTRVINRMLVSSNCSIRQAYASSYMSSFASPLIVPCVGIEPHFLLIFFLDFATCSYYHDTAVAGWRCDDLSGCCFRWLRGEVNEWFLVKDFYVNYDLSHQLGAVLHGRIHQADAAAYHAFQDCGGEEPQQGNQNQSQLSGSHCV